MSDMIETPDMVTRVSKAFRCHACDVRFKAALSSHVSFSVALAEMEALRCPSCGAGPKLIGMGEGRRRNEDEAERIPGNAEERARHWLRTGDRGAAANVLHHYMTGSDGWKWGDRDHPEGIGGLRQCALLLEHMPEWERRLPEMAEVSESWGRLAAAWGGIMRSYRSEAPNFDAPAPITQAMMREALGCER